MAKIVIWMPHDEKHPGHVAIATNEYYVSFWPAKCFEPPEQKTEIRKISKGFDFVMEVHKGCLVFHQDLDKEDEGDCDPDYVHEIDAAKVSNEDLNVEIEAFLRYNEIDPEDVTLAKGEEKYREYKELVVSLPPKEAEQIEDSKLPRKSLSKTKYSISAELVSSSKDNSAPFYNSNQSCVSLAFNLIQLAWLKQHPNPIPIVNHEGIASESNLSQSSICSAMATVVFNTKTPTQFAYKVPWFEREVVQRYMIAQENDNRPMLSVQFLTDFLSEVVSSTKLMFAKIVALIVLGVFFPILRYPLVFAYFILMVREGHSIWDLFILPVLAIAFDYVSSWGVVWSIVIYNAYVFVYSTIMICKEISEPSELIRYALEITVAAGRFIRYTEEVGRPINGVADFFQLFKDFRALQEQPIH
ncbi:uncharacterized protein LOC124201913 [Daphnia pulex]|uniref:uncharacterized protein LOC124201913 n=1 Tax=Daphnia pulex TaxID=6669 RepID=UPI001EDDB2FE|nr:uncharacterized protein LOC124201913 [Daphnia pulex]